MCFEQYSLVFFDLIQEFNIEHATLSYSKKK